MPKTYSVIRKINLGKYGLDYEAIDIGVDGASSFDEAIKEINEQRQIIHTKLSVLARERLEMLEKKVELTFKEDKERQDLKHLINNANSPF